MLSLKRLYISSSTRFKKKKKTLFFKFFGFAPFAIYYLMVLDLDLMVGGYNATFLLYYTKLSVWAHPTIFLAHITWSFLGIKVGVFFTQGAQQLAAFYLFQKNMYIYNLQKHGTFFFVFLG